MQQLLLLCVHVHDFTDLRVHACIAGDDDMTISDAGVTDEGDLFVWDGVQVAGEAIQVGASCEPVLLHVTYPAPSSLGSCVSEDRKQCELVYGFPKNSTLKELKVRVLYMPVHFLK